MRVQDRESPNSRSDISDRQSSLPYIGQAYVEMLAYQLVQLELIDGWEERWA